MAVLQSMKKTSAMTKIIHLKTAFVRRILRLIKSYVEGRVIFHRYLEVSLKDKTHAKRAAQSSAMEFKVHDEMNIAKVSLKELLSNSKTKSQLTELFAEALLQAFANSKQDLVVSCVDKVRSNRSNLPEDMKTHNHEQADTMIPLHVLDAIRVSTDRYRCPGAPRGSGRQRTLKVTYNPTVFDWKGSEISENRCG